MHEDIQSMKEANAQTSRAVVLASEAASAAQQAANAAAASAADASATAEEAVSAAAAAENAANSADDAASIAVTASVSAPLKAMSDVAATKNTKSDDVNNTETVKSEVDINSRNTNAGESEDVHNETTTEGGDVVNNNEAPEIENDISKAERVAALRPRQTQTPLAAHSAPKSLRDAGRYHGVSAPSAPVRRRTIPHEPHHQRFPRRPPQSQHLGESSTAPPASSAQPPKPTVQIKHPHQQESDGQVRKVFVRYRPWFRIPSAHALLCTFALSGKRVSFGITRARATAPVRWRCNNVFSSNRNS